MRLRSFVILIGAMVVSMWTPPLSQATEQAPVTNDQMLKNHAIGLELVKKGDWDGAIDAFLQAVHSAPESYAPLSYYWLAVSYEAKHEDTKAIGAAKKYVEQADVVCPKGHELLAELYIRNKRFDEAEQECNDVISEGGLTPEGMHGHYWYGKICELKQEYDKAKHQYELALGNPPWSFTDAWMAYAEVMMKSKAWSGALSQFGAMLISERKLKGLDLVKVYREMGTCSLCSGDHQAALLNWRKALDLNPADPDTHFYLAMMFESESVMFGAKNHIQSAIDEYKQYLRYSQDQVEMEKVKERVKKLELQLELQPHPAAPELPS